MKIETLRWYALLTTTLLFIDRLTKHIVISYVSYCRLNQFLSVDLVFNRGMSFGLFHSNDAFIFTAVNILIGFVILFLATYSYARVLHGKLIFSEIFIFSGAISNVIDRCVYGGVVDFIALSYQNWHFAVFNLADMFIFFGVAFMIVLEYQQSWKK